MPKIRKSVLVAVVAGVVAVGGAGAAFAYWSASGSGTGTATTGTSTAFTVTSTTSGTALVPGGTGQTVTITVTNSGGGTQQLNGLAVSVANSDGSTWTAQAGCSAADFTVTQPSFTAQSLAAGGTYQTTATLAMVNRAANQDGCKSASVPLYIVAS